MNKLLLFVPPVIFLLVILSGCSNPVYDDFENYINVEMREVSENYEKITTEAVRWAEFKEDAQYITSIEAVILPLVNDSIERLENINPVTEDIQAIKARYVKVMDAYKEGFTLILDGFKEPDEDKMTAGIDKITYGISLLSEYNTTLEEKAKELGAEIGY